MSQLLEAIKAAIRDGDESLNRIATDTGIAASQLSRLLTGERGLSIDVAERLAEYLGIEIIIRHKRGRKHKGQ